VQTKPSPLCNFSIILELGAYSLYDALRDNHYRYDLADVRRFLANLVDAGAYLESKQLVHRDIKPGNIIIFGPRLAFKIADFGLSCKAHQRPAGFAGTLEYCSPMLQEFHRAQLPNRRPISNAFKDDVYSVGLTVSEVLRGIGHDWRKKSLDPRCESLNIIVE
jgi:serine/threonine protein kinase